MKIVKLNKDHNISFPHLTLAVGGFDGIHLGHQKLIQTVIDKAELNETKSAIITFDPTPKAYFASPKEIMLLNTTCEKMDLIRDKFNLDYLIFLAFNKIIANLSYKKFVKDFIVEIFNTKEIVVGFDHRFGHEANGNIENLIQLSLDFGFNVKVVDPVYFEDQPVKSSKIRALLKEGKVETANRMLNYRYQLSCKVISGRKIGSKIGYPTVNVNLDFEKCIPKDGVYLVSSHFDHQLKYGMMYIGKSPTVGSVERHGEIHYFDYDEKMNIEEVTVEFYYWLRGDVKFSSLDELKNQITKDKSKSLELIDELNKAI